MMSKKIRCTLVAGLALVALGAAASSALAANEFLFEEKAGALVPTGTNFIAENLGKAELKATGLTVKCNKSWISGTLTKNKSTGTVETPVAEVQSAVFGGCSEASGNRVVIQTKTTTPWKLEWEAEKKFKLTGISAILKVGTTECSVANKAGSTFGLTWANDPDGFMLSELEAKEQLLTLASISGTCPTEGKETATYKFLAEGLGNNSEKWILET
jgi:hypothetical protein